MAFKKGKEKTGGKVKGTQNKLTATVKEVFTTVFTELQSDSEVNLAAWGKENPTEFYKLCGRLIPAAVDVTTKGESLNDVPVTSWIEKK